MVLRNFDYDFPDHRFFIANDYPDEDEKPTIADFTAKRLSKERCKYDTTLSCLFSVRELILNSLEIQKLVSNAKEDIISYFQESLPDLAAQVSEKIKDTRLFVFSHQDSRKIKEAFQQYNLDSSLIKNAGFVISGTNIVVVFLSTISNDRVHNYSTISHELLHRVAEMLVDITLEAYKSATRRCFLGFEGDEESDDSGKIMEEGFVVYMSYLLTLKRYRQEVKHLFAAAKKRKNFSKAAALDYLFGRTETDNYQQAAKLIMALLEIDALFGNEEGRLLNVLNRARVDHNFKPEAKRYVSNLVGEELAEIVFSKSDFGDIDTLVEQLKVAAEEKSH